MRYCVVGENMVNYQESIEFINTHMDTLRAVIVSSPSCLACQIIIELLESTDIPYCVLNADSPDVVYKPVCYPETSLFTENNKCYTRADVYDKRQLDEWIDLIKTVENPV